MTPRPNSIAEVTYSATNARSFAHELADFLHEIDCPPRRSLNA